MLVNDFDYFNFDNPEHRLDLLERSWGRNKIRIIFDELHKLKHWKSWIKGSYDTEGVPPALLVTGSAKLDTKEIVSTGENISPATALDRLLEVGGFPEPWLEGKTRFYKRSHLDIIFRQDLLDLENVRQITAIETLIQLLRKRVGSPVLYSSLARDLETSDKTIKHWLTILENMYAVFRVTSWHRNIARSLLKRPKFYFYDTGQVLGDMGIRLENTTACALFKEIHFQEDCYSAEIALHYLQTKNGQEIDFLVVKVNTPHTMLEVKWADDSLSKNFKVFDKYFPEINKVQLVRKMAREQTFTGGAGIRKAHTWLASFSLKE